MAWIFMIFAPQSLDELAAELLAAAEKYALEDLKSICEQQLMSSLDIENAVDLFLLADIYLAPSLRKNAVQLLAWNLNEVLTNTV
jgi:speckle-type POZ protein